MEVSVVRNPFFPGKDNEHYFSLSPREAALAAFALYTMGNHKEETWQELYGPRLVAIKDGSYICENWRAVELENLRED